MRRKTVIKNKKAVSSKLSSWSEHWQPTSTWPKSGKHRSQILQKVMGKKRRAENRKNKLKKMRLLIPKL